MKKYKTFPIFFKDLTEEAKQRYLEACKLQEDRLSSNLPIAEAYTGEVEDDDKWDDWWDD